MLDFNKKLTLKMDRFMFARGILTIWIETGFPSPLTMSYFKVSNKEQLVFTQ